MSTRNDDMVLINDGGDQFKVRLPGDLHDRLRRAAKSNSRSANAEIVHRLNASFSVTQALDREVASALERFVEAEVSRRLTAIASRIGGRK